jgi:hypothetical protein
MPHAGTPASTPPEPARPVPGSCGDPDFRVRACELSDAAALNGIAEMLRDPDWGAGMLEDIGELVTATGRSIEDYPDGRPTWDRH